MIMRNEDVSTERIKILKKSHFFFFCIITVITIDINIQRRESKRLLK